MGDYAFDEDNAELRKLNMEVVCYVNCKSHDFILTGLSRSRTQMSLKIGKSWFAPQNHLKVA